MLLIKLEKSQKLHHRTMKKKIGHVREILKKEIYIYISLEKRQQIIDGNNIIMAYQKIKNY